MICRKNKNHFKQSKYSHFDIPTHLSLASYTVNIVNVLILMCALTAHTFSYSKQFQYSKLTTSTYISVELILNGKNKSFSIGSQLLSFRYISLTQQLTINSFRPNSSAASQNAFGRWNFPRYDHYYFHIFIYFVPTD